MKIRIISDIHLEFGLRDFDFSNCDLLVLAGDIHLGILGVEWILQKVKDIPVIYVLGNHEYYKHSYPKLIGKMKNRAEGSNIHVLENEKQVIDGIAFHCATLWTDFELFGDPRIAGFECQQKMNDYYQIRRDPSYSRLRSIDTHVIHNESLKWLGESLRAGTEHTNIVVTHHAPSIRSIAPEYREEMLSAAFASNLEGFISQYQPDLWIHGHIHQSSDYFLGKTRVLCNACGYPNEQSPGFTEKLIIEL